MIARRMFEIRIMIIFKMSIFDVKSHCQAVTFCTFFSLKLFLVLL
jgi:hypothetical protein